MRSFTPKIIAIASLLAAMPLSSAYAVHRHRVEPSGMSVEAKVVVDQLQGVKQGIVEARVAGIFANHDLLSIVLSVTRISE
ncbi:hypothetical protein [Mesorhizobium opportunistum]|uniref:Transport-associated protein n=1 Tax=Mesorhizobium opportunistum (strain LMG 24607 / HAMBI 3007 / WSM2075) TaxID=536019 RepID=F7YAC9_MESOW|nr:hypothetical protein [Mesorhizobium opportunistum]AEH86528.1 conserved hypothetical protein [Mesorhizobium opportunistum WSM2075]